MAISADYPTPVTVNGFSCRNCSEVDLAKKHIDPAHPAAGPFGINDHTHDKSKTASASAVKDKAAQKSALAYDRTQSSSYTASADATKSNAIGATVDVHA